MSSEDLGRIIAGRYRLVDVLGEGGMASVYQADDLQARRSVAVKIIKASKLRHAITHTRFHREARAIAKLDHPGFARLLDWGIEHGAPFMVMEIVEGESLRAVLRRHARLSTHVALRIGIAVCEQLEHVHACGLAHRDIKPGNIMVQSLSDAQIKLIDFGIAKQLIEARGDSTMALTNPMALTMEGSMMGSPPYCSPQQLRGQDVDTRTDIYSVGVLLYRTVTGKAPFSARNSILTACKQLSSPPEPPSSVFPFIDEELDKLIMRCMESDPERRVRTVTDLRGALSGILHRLEEAPATIPVQRASAFWVNELVMVTAAAVALGATSAWLLG
jgi:serine/threonine protein kinase